MIGQKKFLLIHEANKTGSVFVVYAVSREFIDYWFDLPKEGTEIVEDGIEDHPLYKRFHEVGYGIVPEMLLSKEGVLRTVTGVGHVEQQLEGKKGVSPPGGSIFIK